jgi:hypothetical protein
VTNFLEEKRKEIAARMRELEPLVAEYRQLEAAASALAGVTPARANSTRSRSGRPRKAAGTRRRGRPRGSGTRGAQALDLVRRRPGITIPEMAASMGIKQNYLYRVLARLEKERQVVKRDRGWHPTS